MANQEIVTTEKKEIASVESFISQAIDKGVPMETLERLFTLREKVKAEQAKEAFTEAMAKFQAECPIIEKKKIVKDKNGKERYRYAPLDEIVAQVKTALSSHGLSYRFDENKDDKFTEAICTITHSMGHSEKSSFKVEIGKEDFMTDTQKYGARMTFAKRYAFCNALGILTGDEDTDAGEDEKVEVSDELKKKIEDCTTLEQLKAVWEANKGLGTGFAKLVTAHKKFITDANKDDAAS